MQNPAISLKFSCFMLLLVLVVCVSGTNKYSSGPEIKEVKISWYNYLSKEAKVSLKFPEVYEEKKQQGSNGKIISVQALRKDDIFDFWATISVIPFPNPESTAKIILENNLRKHASTVIRQNTYAYKNYTGYEAVYRDMDGTNYYRCLIIENIIYQMRVSTAKDNIQSDITTFFESFEYKGEKIVKE
jgi:hypothetical protein